MNKISTGGEPWRLMIDLMTPVDDMTTELREAEKEEAAVLIPQIAVMTRY